MLVAMLVMRLMVIDKGWESIYLKLRMRLVTMTNEAARRNPSRS